MRGVLLILAMMATMMLLMRLSASSESPTIMLISGFASGLVLIGLAIKVAAKFELQTDLWTLAIATGIFAITTQVWPSDYSDTLGWLFVVGMIIGILALAFFGIIKLSKNYERSS